MPGIERLSTLRSPQERAHHWGLRLAGEITDAILADDDSYVVRDRRGVAGQLHDPDVYEAMARYVNDADIEVHRFKTDQPILLRGSSDSGEIPDRPLTYDVVFIDPEDTGIIELVDWGEHVERLYPSEE